MPERSKVRIKLKVLGARVRRVGSRPTVRPDAVRQWRSISPRARRRKYWVVGTLSAAIAAQFAVLLIAGGGAPPSAHGSL